MLMGQTHVGPNKKKTESKVWNVNCTFWECLRADAYGEI
jgi:hypothetical protein